MAAGLIAKGRLVVLGNAHELLNKLIDTNSPVAMKQYVRDIETQLMELQTEVGGQDGQLRMMTRELQDLRLRKANTEKVTQQILAGSDPNKETIAQKQAALIVDLDKQIEDKAQAVETQRTTLNNMQSAVSQLHGKHDQLVQRVRDLERMDRDSKAKERAVAAVRQVNQLMGGVDSFSVDDVQERMRQRNDVASAQFDHEIGDLNATADAPVTQENAQAVEDVLSRLRPKAEQEKREAVA